MTARVVGELLDSETMSIHVETDDGGSLIVCDLNEGNEILRELYLLMRERRAG